MLTYIAFAGELPVAVGHSEKEVRGLAAPFKTSVTVKTFPANVYEVVMAHGGWSAEAFKAMGI